MSGDGCECLYKAKEDGSIYQFWPMTWNSSALENFALTENNHKKCIVDALMSGLSDHIYCLLEATSKKM